MEAHDIDVNEIYRLDKKIPAWIYIDLPKDKKEKSIILANQLYNGPIYAQTDLYSSYYDKLDSVFDESIDPSTLDDEIKKNVSDNGKIYPYIARYGKGYIEIDGHTGEFLKIHQ